MGTPIIYSSSWFGYLDVRASVSDKSVRASVAPPPMLLVFPRGESESAALMPSCPLLAHDEPVPLNAAEKGSRSQCPKTDEPYATVVAL